jgi:hypothetical protein
VSLKQFHLFFIACSLALMAFIGAWTRAQAAAGQAWPGVNAAGLAGGLLALGYLGWFLRRYKSLS